MSLKKMLIDNQDESMTKQAKNNLLLKQKFGNMFIHARDHLEEVRVGLHASAVISSDSEFCYRAQVLSLVYQQAQGHELPVKLLSIFAAGSYIHEKWQNMFEKVSGNMKGFKLIRNEARSFDERYELYFTPDSIVEINGVLYVVEIKSMNTYAYQHAVKSSNPHPSARKQIQLYMYLTGIPNGIIIIEDKNNQDFEIIPVEFNYKEVLPYIDRMNEVMEMKKAFIEEGVEPPRVCKNAKTKKAEGCNMKSACFNCDGGRKKINE